MEIILSGFIPYMYFSLGNTDKMEKSFAWWDREGVFVCLLFFSRLPTRANGLGGSAQGAEQYTPRREDRTVGK